MCLSQRKAYPPAVLEKKHLTRIKPPEIRWINCWSIQET